MTLCSEFISQIYEHPRFSVVIEKPNIGQPLLLATTLFHALFSGIPLSLTDETSDFLYTVGCTAVLAIGNTYNLRIYTTARGRVSEVASFNIYVPPG